MNVINSIAKIQEISCSVFTTKNKKSNWFRVKNINIIRISKQSNNFFFRYWLYIHFNIKCFVGLILKNPDSILIYETYSVLPPYVYKILFRKVSIIIHFHEYETLEEIRKSSAYSKILHRAKKKLLIKADCISQTNNERKNLFLEDNPLINDNKVIVAPNYPPSEWFEYSKLNTTKNKTGSIKLVHVGAVSLDTMYTEEIVNWVMAQNGAYQLDFYTDNITKDAKLFFDSLSNNNIRLLGGENYFMLPNLLIKYDIGLTLYNGHIPNYIYNVPNKVLEYLACGLNVWYSSELVSTHIFVKKNKIVGCDKIHFGRINNTSNTEISRQIIRNVPIKFNSESKLLLCIKKGGCL